MEYHILNGDALHERINELHNGQFIICREALIEGPIDQDDFEIKRAAFLGVSLEEYKLKSSSQLDAIKNIPPSSEINLWFEDDLFCQCNMWFIINLLLSISLKANVYLVRPTSNSWTGFGYMNENEFAQAYKNRILLNQEQLGSFQKLWKTYSSEKMDNPQEIADQLTEIIPRIKEVLQAHLDRCPPHNRPLQSLKKIIEKNEDKSFPTVFKQFCEEEGIYGFGDTSIKRMYDQLMKQ